MIGEWHEFADGYRFRETMHGPLMPGRCVDCPAIVFVGVDLDDGEPRPQAPPRCSTCGRRAHGLSVPATMSYITELPIEPPVCRFAAGSLGCVVEACANPRHMCITTAVVYNTSATVM